MPYESLDQLVTTVEQHAVERSHAKEQVERSLALRREQLERVNEVAAKLFEAHGGEYDPSDNYRVKFEEATAKGEVPFGPWDKTDSLPIPLGMHGDKQGLAIISALTVIGKKSEPITRRERSWFGVMRERTHYISRPYVAQVTGYAIEIVLGDGAAIHDRSRYTPVAFEHTSSDITERNVKAFEDLLGLVTSRKPQADRS